MYSICKIVNHQEKKIIQSRPTFLEPEDYFPKTNVTTILLIDSIQLQVASDFHKIIIINFSQKLLNLLYTDALPAPGDAPLAYLSCAINLHEKKNGLIIQKHSPFLPGTRSLPWCKGA